MATNGSAVFLKSQVSCRLPKFDFNTFVIVGCSFALQECLSANSCQVNLDFFADLLSGSEGSTHMNIVPAVANCFESCLPTMRTVVGTNVMWTVKCFWFVFARVRLWVSVST